MFEGDKKFNSILLDFEKKFNINDDKKKISFLLKELYSKLDLQSWVNFNLTKLKNKGVTAMLDSKRLYSDNSIALIDNEAYTFGILTTPSIKVNSEILYNNNLDLIVCPILISKPVHYKIYRQDNELAKPEILDNTVVHTVVEEGKFQLGKSIFIRKFTDIWDVSKNSFYVCFYVFSKSNNYPFIWEYLIKNDIIIPKRLVLIDRDAPKLMVVFKILDSYSSLESEKLLLIFAKHTVHSVRWEAARALININFSKGVELLKKMKLEDPHPEIREASNTSLNQIN